MRKYKKQIIVLILILFLLSAFNSVQAFEFKEELFLELADAVNEIPEIGAPDYSVLELENGLKVYIAEDPKLPLIEIRAYLEGGTVEEDKNNTGISSLMAELMNLETKNYSENELARYKEINALSLKISADYDRFNISANSLNTEADKLISLMAEVMQRPKFEGDHFKRTVNEYQQLYRQQFYNDSALLNMHFFKNLYGAHPYGYNNDFNLILDFLKDVEAEDLQQFYQQTINPEDLIIAVSGDFKSAEIKELFRSNFKDWQNSNFKAEKKYVNVNPAVHNKILIVNKADATQAKMRIGHNFYSSKFPKRTAFLMGNRIFGSGAFNSRLMENLRSDKGYVYGVNAQTKYNDYGGAYFVNLSVKPERALDSLRAVKEEMREIKNNENPFTDKELFENINLYNAVFPKAYKEKISVLDELMYQIEIRDKSKDYINNFIEQYNGLTAPEVQQIFAEEIYPEIMMTVIVGPKNEIIPVFESEGVDFEVIE